MLLSQKLSHAYIIIADPEDGYAAARELAQAMLCSGDVRPCGACRDCRKAEKGIHPDIITITRQTDDKGKLRREIYVEQIREIVADAAVMPNEADTKVYIIRDAGMMNSAAQNALLKILEEPSRFVAFILVADAAEALLETVRSRCVLRYCGAGEDDPGAEARGRAERFLDAALSGAKLTLLSFANEHADLGNAEMLEFVLAAQLFLTDMLCGRLPALQRSPAELMRLAALMKKAEEYLRFNVSTKHVLGLLAVEAAGEHTTRGNI